MIDYNFFLHDAVPILRCNGTDDHADAVEWAVTEIERLREALGVVLSIEARDPGHVDTIRARDIGWAALGGKP